MISPGKPPPDPRSIQTSASGARSISCSESATWRVHRCGIVDGAIRLVVRCQVSNNSTKRSRRCVVSRETSNRESACARSVERSGAAEGKFCLSSPQKGGPIPPDSGKWAPACAAALSLSSSARDAHALSATCLPLEMRDQQRQCRRRDPIDASSLANGAGTQCLQLVADFVREPAQLRVVERRRQLEAFVATIGCDVGGLA